MLKIIIYNIAVINILFLFYYLTLNVEFIIFLSLSLVFFFLYIILKKFVLYKFFNILDSIYYFYYYLLFLNKLTITYLKVYSNILDYLLIDIIKSIFLFLINILINKNLLKIYLDIYKKNIKKFYTFFIDISLLLLYYLRFLNFSNISYLLLTSNLENFNNSYIYINMIVFNLLLRKHNSKNSFLSYVS